MLTELEFKVLEFIKNKKKENKLMPITNKLVSESIGLSKPYVIKALNGLINKSFIYRTNFKYYELCEK